MQVNLIKIAFADKQNQNFNNNMKHYTFKYYSIQLDPL